MLGKEPEFDAIPETGKLLSLETLHYINSKRSQSRKHRFGWETPLHVYLLS